MGRYKEELSVSSAMNNDCFTRKTRTKQNPTLMSVADTNYKVLGVHTYRY
jgi:hypothetical protein